MCSNRTQHHRGTLRCNPSLSISKHRPDSRIAPATRDAAKERFRTQHQSALRLDAPCAYSL
jgi:hypothetical protein